MRVGIASLLLPAGRNAHSRFVIPLELMENNTCGIKQNTQLAELMQEVQLIIWDEAPMTQRYDFEALDITLRDILGFTDSERRNQIFGGMTVLLGGDFRQILPVIPKAKRPEVVQACINRSELWMHYTVIVKLKEQIKSLKGNVEDSSVKMDMDEIETLNIELEHRVTKLVTENEHLKQTYKQLYDSIKPKRVQSKEQCDALIKQVNIKSGEISDLNAKLQEQGLVIAALKNELRKLKGKAIDNKETVTHSVDPNVSKDNMEPITPKLLNKRTAHSSYIKHTQEEALVLRDIVEHVKANYPQDPLLESAFRYTKVIQDLLSHISRSCPSINNCGPQLIEAIPRKKDKKVRFAESLTSKENTKPASTSNIVSNKRVLHSTGVRLSTSASGSQPSGNTKNDRILQTPSSNLKNKVEAHPRNVKSSLNKKNGTVNVNGSAVVQNLKKQDDSDCVCIHRDDCMSSDNLCVSNSLNVVKSRAKSKKNKSKKDSWKPTGKVVQIRPPVFRLPLLEGHMYRRSPLSSPISQEILGTLNWDWIKLQRQFCDFQFEVAFRQHHAAFAI
ncbi:retrovirus-related pol polyprotein from transposon TNT 1-94 [Tanacetum coccineum]